MTAAPMTRAYTYWTGAPGEFRPPKYASPQRLTADGKPLPTAGRLVGRWQERYLVHGEGDALGDPIRLPLFWWYLLNRIYEFDPDTGELAYDRVLIGMGKGNDKTEGCARLGVGELLGPVAPLRSPRVVVSAASYDQTSELFSAARLCIEGDPAHDKPGPLSPYFKDGQNLLTDRILLPTGVGRLERIAAVGATNDGGKPTAHIGDEMHEWTTERKERVYTVQGKSLRKRGVPRRTPKALGLPDGIYLHGSLQIGITTAGFSLDTLLGRLYEHGIAVARGEVDDPKFLFLWWEADDHWDLDDPAQRTQAILQANPAAGDFLPLQSIHSSYLDPTVAEHEFYRYNLDRWPGDALRWMPKVVWEDCEGDPVMAPDEPTRAVVTIAHDHRSAAIAVTQRQGDKVLLRVRSFPDGPLRSNEFVPVDDLEQYVLRLHRRYAAPVLSAVRYRPQARERHLMQAGPEVIYHGSFFEGSAQRLRKAGVVMVDVPDTGQQLTPAAESLRGLAIEGQLEHDGDRTLSREIGLVMAREAAKGWLPQAAGPAARAAMLAVHRAITAPRDVSRTIRWPT
jgi:phage terminase large subunit-like protein